MSGRGRVYGIKESLKMNIPVKQIPKIQLFFTRI